MILKFWCISCKKIFENEGNKKEWIDVIYGPCMKYIAECPECKTECNEYREPSYQKKSSQTPQMGCAGHCNNCEYSH
ncbi:MAG: hypothetical protein HGB12_05900 [Bacteroidetes bacterium]|nr:hypothetical protein [Bacteroidota bacterium]